MPFLLWPINPRRPLFWKLLLLAGLVFRVYAVLVLRNPMDAIFSDAGRHWDNAKHFVHPGAMGASNPYLYQLFLWILREATHDNKTAVGIVTAALSVAYPLAWYAFAVRVMRRRINALRFAAVLCWLPTHISMFGFFMNEALLLPLLGLALWATHRSLATRRVGSFLFTATTWTLAVLTRSVVGPVGLVCVAYAWLKMRRGRWVALAGATAITAVCVGAAAEHAHRVLKRYTPFGDSTTVAIYFVSGALSYQVTFPGAGTYGFGSPSFASSPFEPYADFKTARVGKVAFVADPDKKGEDVRQVLREQLHKNWRKLPRLVYENFVYLSFGRSWPMGGSIGDRPDKICQQERWMWFPLTLVSLVGSVAYLKRRRAAFVPVLALGFIFVLYVLGQVAPMEGRYRKPLEPVMLLAPLWLWDARRMRQPGKQASQTKIRSAGVRGGVSVIPR